MTVDEAISQVAEELGLEFHVVRRAYLSMYEFIVQEVGNMQLKEEFLSKEEYEKVSKIFNFPVIGKIAMPYSKYKGVWEGYLKKLDKNKTGNVQAKED